MSQVVERRETWRSWVLLAGLLLCVVLCGLGGLVVWDYWWRTSRRWPTARTLNEVAQLGIALNSFKSRFGSYLPSRIKLCRNLKDYDRANPLDRDSMQLLMRLFPRMDPAVDHDWGGSVGRLPAVLQGDQCLVFFLGGIPDRQLYCTGFSADPRDPPQLTGDRIGPFYEFPFHRLIADPENGFFSYLDGYGGQPYAYFSSYGRRNGYNRYFPDFHDSDCSRLGVWPYAVTLGESPSYYNPNTFQIISTGPDGAFGLGSRLPDGSTWSPAKADRIDAPGRDDLSNFYPMPLGQ